MVEKVRAWLRRLLGIEALEQRIIALEETPRTDAQTQQLFSEIMDEYLNGGRSNGA